MIIYCTNKILDSSKIKSIYQIEETLRISGGYSSVTGPSHQRCQSGQRKGG